MRKFVIILAMALVCGACYAQRQSGGSSRGSVSSSRSSVSSYSGSRSSSSMSSSRSNSYSTTSRSSSVSSSPSRSSSYATPSRTTTTYSTPTQRNSNVSRQYTPSTRTSTNGTRTTTQTTRSRSDYSHSERVSRPLATNRPMSGQTSPGSRVYGPENHHHVPHGMHPHPPMYHPIHHHHHIHMHHCIVHDWCCDYYWHSYWHYYHCHPHADVIVYMNSSNYARIIALADDSYYIYSLIDEAGCVYLTITDESDHVLVKTQVHRKYCKLITGDDGVWVFKNRDRDPIFVRFLDGQLYMYEKD